MKESRYTPDSGAYFTYAIHAYTSTGCGWSYCLSVSDVSADFSAVQQLAQQCTDLQLEPVHLLDVVNDFLNS